MAMRNTLTILLGTISFFYFPGAPAEAQNRTILILDLTAQMSAKLGQQRKIDAAKSAIGAAVSRMDPEASVSLWAFGTNPAQKCDGKKELAGMQGAGKAAPALSKALDALQPRAARAPVFGTLQSALEAAGGPPDRAVTAVVIAGTGDDCTGDICSEAKGLHSTYPNAKLTVLGIGMTEAPAANYDCAAKAMGGAFTPVKSGSDLDRVLRQTLGIAANAPKVASAQAQQTVPPSPAPAAAENKPLPESGAATGSQPAPAAQAEVKQAAPSQAEPNIALSATLASGMPPLGSGVTWELFKVTTTPTGQLRVAETPSFSAGGGQITAKLAAGRYQIRASYGFASAEDELTAGPDKIEKTVALGAGTIEAEAFLATGASRAEDAFFVLLRRKSPAALEELGRSSQMPAVFHVNQGEYVLSAGAGLAKVEMKVRVEMGRTAAVKLALGAGTLEFKTFAVEGSGKPAPAWHRIFAEGDGAAKSGVPVLRLRGSSHRLQLPAGNYRIETEYGAARAANTVTVAAGQAVSRTIVLEAGEAAITMAPGKPASVCAVFEAGADRNAGAAGRAAGTSMTFILKAGLYDVECKSKGQPSGQAQIRVAAGQTVQAKVGE
jgi:hypothetical protein